MEESYENNWQQIGDWENGRVRSGAKSLIWISLLFGIAFTGLSLPAVLALPGELSKGNYAALLVLLFLLVGMGALGLFAYSLAAWRKFGKTELILNPVPGSIGGDFGGYLDTRINWHPELNMDITLNCQRLKTTGSGKNRSTSTTVVWQREGIATLSLGPKGTRCKFRFEIPDNLPQSEASSSDYHQWLLQLECALPGVDFKRNFIVPVIRTDEPQRSSMNISYIKELAPLTQAPERIVRIRNTDHGMEFYYPWSRHLWMGIMTIMFGSIFAITGYIIGRESSELVFPVVFGGIGATCIIAGLYLLGNTLTTTITGQGIRIVRNIFGIRFQRKATLEDIKKLQRRISSQMQTGSNTRVYYALDAHTHDGRRITIADTLEGSRLADYIEDKVSTVLWPEKENSSAGLKLEI